MVPVIREGAYEHVQGLVRANAPQARGSTAIGVLTEVVLDELAAMLLTGLVTQLADIPADCRIDRHLYRQAPELRAEQRVALSKMLTQYSEVLNDDIRRRTPYPLWRAAVAMDGAFAANSAKLFSELSSCAERYLATGLGTEISALERHLHGPDEGRPSDVAATDLWAHTLQLRNIYEWRRLQIKAVAKPRRG